MLMTSLLDTLQSTMHCLVEHVAYFTLCIVFMKAVSYCVPITHTLNHVRY